MRAPWHNYLNFARPERGNGKRPKINAINVVQAEQVPNLNQGSHSQLNMKFKDFLAD